MQTTHIDVTNVAQFAGATELRGNYIVLSSAGLNPMPRLRSVFGALQLVGRTKLPELTDINGPLGVSGESSLPQLRFVGGGLFVAGGTLYAHNLTLIRGAVRVYGGGHVSQEVK